MFGRWHEPLHDEGNRKDQAVGEMERLSAAYDILDDAGVDKEKIEVILAAALRDGQNPEVIARKLVHLRAAVRESTDG